MAVRRSTRHRRAAEVTTTDHPAAVLLESSIILDISSHAPFFHVPVQIVETPVAIAVKSLFGSESRNSLIHSPDQVRSCSPALRTTMPRLRSKSKADSEKPRIMPSRKHQIGRTNEKKTPVRGHSGAARRRWIVVRSVGLARVGVRQIEHGQRP